MADPKAMPQASSKAEADALAALDAELAKPAQGAPQAAPSAGVDPRLAALDAELAATPAPSPAPAGAPAAPNQTVDTGTSTIEGALNDVGVGITEAPQAIVRGAVEAVHQTTGTAKRVADAVLKPDTGSRAVDFGIEYALRPIAGFREAWDAVNGVTGSINKAIPKPTTITGSITEGVSQFVVGMLGAGKLFKAAGIAAPTTVKGVIGQGMAKGALVDAAAFDPLGERLSNLANDHGFGTDLSRYLAAKPGDSRAEGAFKNAVEGLLLGAAMEGVIRTGAKIVKLARDGDTAAAAKATIKFDDDFARMINQLDRPGAYEGNLARPDEFAPRVLPDGTSIPTRLYADGRALDGDASKYGTFARSLSEERGGQHGAPVTVEITKPWRHDAAMPADEAAQIVERFKKLYPGKAESFDSVFHRESAPGAFDRATPDASAAHGVEPFSGQPGAVVSGAQFREKMLSHAGGDAAAREFDQALKALGYDAVSIDGPSGRAWNILGDQQPQKIVRGAEPEAKPVEPNPAIDPNSVQPAKVEKLSGTPTAAHGAQVSAPPAPPSIARGVKPALVDIPPEAQEKIVKAINARWTYGRDAALSGDEFNMLRYTDAEEFHSIISAFERNIGDAISKRVGGNADGVRTHAQVQKTADGLAEMFGTDGASIIASLRKTGINVAQLDSNMLAYRMFMRTVTEQAAAKAAAAVRPGADPAAAAMAAAEALNGARIAAQVIAEFKGVQTNVARAMSAQRIAVGGKQTAMSFTQLAEQLARTGLSDADRAMLKQLSTLSDPKALRRYLEASYGRRASDSFVEYYINALLSGPKTHIVNFVTSAAHTGYAPIERALAGFMPGGVGGREAIHRMVDEYHGLFLGLWDSIKTAGVALKTGAPVLDEAGKSAAERAGTDRNAISAHRWGLTRDIYDIDGSVIRPEATPVLSWVVDGLGRVINIPSRLLMTQDELFKNLVYRSKLYTDAASEARGLNLKGDARAKHIADRMEEGFERNGVGTNQEALQRAREVTFTQDLEYGVGQWLQQGVGRLPMMRVVVPFVRTPTNLIRWTWQRTPVVQFAQRQFLDDIKAGGERAAQSYAKIATGGAFYALATYLAMNEHVTGGGPLDPDLRRIKEATGWQPYSFKTADGKYISYSRGDPFFMPLGLAADFVDTMGHMSDQKADELAGALVTSLAKNLTSKTYLQGITNLFSSLGDFVQGRSKNPLESWAHRTVGSVVVPSIIANFKGEDEAQREVYSVMDAIRGRLPDNFLGLGNKGTQSLPASYNLFGEKVAPSAFLGPDQWSPLAARDHKNDPLADEVANVMYRIDHAFARPSYTLGETKIDLRHIKTDDGKNAYERYNQLIGTVEGGVRKALTELVNTKEYRAAGYGDRDFAMSPGSRLYMLNAVVQAYREAARERLLADNPKLLAVYRAETERALTSGTIGKQERGYEPPSFMESVFGK